jgi:2,4-dienoyl-CoA reductase (NADPH2)
MGRYSFSFLWGEKPIAPSAIPSKLTKQTPREMTQEDIDELQQGYVGAAVRAQVAGFDYVEILACTGYLISEFLSPLTNHRTDEYGGSLENRMRFGVELIQKVRKAVGDDMALGVRIAGNDFRAETPTSRTRSSPLRRRRPGSTPSTSRGAGTRPTSRSSPRTFPRVSTPTWPVA